MPRKKIKTEVSVSPFHLFLYSCLIGFVMIMIIGFTMLSGSEYTDTDHKLPEFRDPHRDGKQAAQDIVTQPIILWWAPIGPELGKYKKCGKKSCFISSDRHYYNHYQTKVLMFYGSNIVQKDFPVPRKPYHEWALIHEESPKNNYALCHPDLLGLFNHTSTFQRDSDFSLITQYIDSVDWLMTSKFLVPTAEKTRLQKELAPLMYVQSDCNTPSDRDAFVKLLMNELKVDSYGSCLHNKDLPENIKDPIPGMDSEDFFKIQAKYKFTIAMENAVCDDYITEKIWRPLRLGSVPIIRGSPKIKDLLPDEHSAIIIDDFKNVKELVDHLKYLLKHDEEYEKYLQWKKTGITNKYLKELLANRTWSISDTWMEGRTNFVEDFECFVCNRIHENMRRSVAGEWPAVYMANKNHLDCPKPLQYNSEGIFEKDNYNWITEFNTKSHEAKAVRYFVDKNLPMPVGDFHAKVSEIRYYSKDGWW